MFKIDYQVESVVAEKGEILAKVLFLQPSENIGVKREIVVVTFLQRFLFISSNHKQVLKNKVDDFYIPVQFDLGSLEMKAMAAFGDTVSSA